MAKGRTKRARKRAKPHAWLVLRNSKIHGRGVYARKKIPRGTRIIEYAGELIGNAEADRRYDDDRMARHHTFLFILDSRHCVDAAVGGNISRFINHACDPNCVAWIEEKHIWIDALRDIRVGEELGYEYEYDFLPEYTIEELQFYSCKCGSPKCRGTIVDVPKSKWHLVRALRRRRRAKSRRRARSGK